MTRRISITGIDGTGKSTVVRELARRYASQPSFIQAFRAMQYHENPGVPHAELSADIEALSVLADRRKNPVLKATCLFLAMTPYGDVERYYTGRFIPRLLIGERQPLVDSLVYASFYTRLVSEPLDPASLTDEISRAIGDDGLERLEAWMGTLSRRDPDLSSGFESFWSLPLYMKELFSLPVNEILPRLRAVYAVSEPDEIIALAVSGPSLEQRLVQKRGAGTEREIHEKRSGLEILQRALLGALGEIRKAYPEVRIHELDTSALGVEETADRIMTLVSGKSFAAQVVDHSIKGAPDLG